MWKYRAALDRLTQLGSEKDNTMWYYFAWQKLQMMGEKQVFWELFNREKLLLLQKHKLWIDQGLFSRSEMDWGSIYSGYNLHNSGELLDSLGGALRELGVRFTTNIPRGWFILLEKKWGVMKDDQLGPMCFNLGRILTLCLDNTLLYGPDKSLDLFREAYPNPRRLHRCYEPEGRDRRPKLISNGVYSPCFAGGHELREDRVVEIACRCPENGIEIYLVEVPVEKVVSTCI